MLIDFIATETHFMEHIVPIYYALKENAGNFYATGNVNTNKYPGVNWKPLNFDKHNYMDIPDDEHPVVISAYRALDRLVATELTFHHIPRFKIFTEHGAGFSFANSDPSYAGGTGERKYVNLFLAPNDFVVRKNIKTYPTIPNIIVGCPKLDKWDKHKFEKIDPPIIAVSFHWDCQIAPETTSAWLFYKDALPELAKKYKVIGHGHPRIMGMLAAEYQKMGIEPVWDFEEVMERASLYANDCSSTLYEFAYTGKPVVVINSRKYRREVKHGLRFWEYSNVGYNCNSKDELLPVIEKALLDPPEQQLLREEAVKAVYPERGNAAKLAAKAIMDMTVAKIHKVRKANGKSVGIVYMSFGENASKEVRKSIGTMRRQFVDVPITVIGSTPVADTNFIEWKGETPFDRTQRNNFHFRAGRIKPRLYSLSPYDLTLYIDADTEYMSPDFIKGFTLLDGNDIIVTQELLNVNQLYNKALAGWEINIQERDQTIKEIGNGNVPFWNTGVMFFAKTKQAERLFEDWHTEWMRFQQWDEQLAFMRAAYRNPKLSIVRLGVEWNAPHKTQAKYIFHNYGRGNARSNQ